MVASPGRHLVVTWSSPGRHLVVVVVVDNLIQRVGQGYPGLSFFGDTFVQKAKTARPTRIRIYPPKIYFLHFLVYHQVDDRN
jgi:hypothetical protein